MSERMKYLEVVLDQKLSQKDNFVRGAFKRVIGVIWAVKLAGGFIGCADSLLFLCILVKQMAHMVA